MSPFCPAFSGLQVDQYGGKPDPIASGATLSACRVMSETPLYIGKKPAPSNGPKSTTNAEIEVQARATHKGYR